MGTIGTLPGDRLAGLLIDQMEKIRKGVITLDELALFTQRKNPFEQKHAGEFNPAAFISKGWEIVGERKALLEGWRPKQLVGISARKSVENYIDGREWKKRLAEKPLLGVEAFWLCWNNQKDIPEELRSMTIFFDGDELQRPGSDRCSLCLYCIGDRWKWNYYSLSGNRGDGCVSAAASQN